MGSCRKFDRRFAEGIGKLVGNAKGDCREEDRRTNRKIAGGCRSMRGRRLDHPYHRIRATANKCQRVNCPDDRPYHRLRATPATDGG
ncbi:hypothetical protein B296_00038359 [Ensete ventricosum]|uniref:Uncharacterized protein n=1 Tax=Ensete ventricosum TaxID=4639 RepID=A0A426ZCX2_ENSVE|nr:hypothetical protein B296_00038359 [Ensete ventricosum]